MICLYIKTNDLRASTSVMVVPVRDALRVLFWRSVCRTLDRAGLRARTEHDTHPARLWVQWHAIRACLRCRNMAARCPYGSA